MGFWDDIAKGLKSVTDYNKSETEKIKAQNKKVNNKRLAKENRELKKAISKGHKIGMASIGVTIVVAVAAVIIGYMLLVYFPIQNS